MKTIFMGKKPYASKSLEYMITQGFDIVAVVANPDIDNLHWFPKLFETAKRHKLPVYTDKQIYNIIAGNISEEPDFDITNIDLVISYLYWNKIKPELINISKYGCINFHPAPLPDLRGVGGYNIAILENMNYYGASAHFIEETIDTGDLIYVDKFEINPLQETAYSLEQKTQVKLFEVFKRVIDTITRKENLPRIQQGEGRYISKKDFEVLRLVKETDTPEIIDRKIRAFWYPPREGACIKKNGQEYTLVNNLILNEIGKHYH
jgi:methionyl-tRNA formyltransferase